MASGLFEEEDKTAFTYKVRQALWAVDDNGKEIRFKFNHSDSIKTSCGGIISIMTKLLILAYISSKITLLIN
jgi:hypothetical protein